MSQPVRVCFFGTHPTQFNGYSRVVYELSRAVARRNARPGQSNTRIALHVFGFQRFNKAPPGHRQDMPSEVDVYDAASHSAPGTEGFGFEQVRAYVERIRPDVVVVLNDLIVVTNVLRGLEQASNRKQFRVIIYADQVYLCQRKELLENVNRAADAAIAFTPAWRACLEWQGLKVPCGVLEHGFNPRTCFPIPRRLVRRFYGIAESDFLVLNLNRNQPRKRWDTCLQAFAEVVARRPTAPIRLVIATDTKGAWDLVELYQRELKKRGVSVEAGMARLITPGHPQVMSDEDVTVLYNLADVGINTCDGEGWGLCNFEQAAIGIPQVVPRIGGFAHFFDDDIATLIDPITTVYVDSGRDGVGGEAQLTLSDDYADAILKYYDDPALRDRHGHAARERILSRFSWDRIADDFAAVVAPAQSSAEDALPSSVPSDDDDVEAVDLGALRSEASVVPPLEEPAAVQANKTMADELCELQARIVELQAKMAVT